MDEALSAYLLVVRADGLTFWHKFVRQAVARMLAEPVQQALHWQYGRMLLARGALAMPPPAREAVVMRCTLASLLALTGRATKAMTEAQTVLTKSGVPVDLRDQATVALMWAWLGLRGNQQADQLAGTILAEPSTVMAGAVPRQLPPEPPAWKPGTPVSGSASRWHPAVEYWNAARSLVIQPP